MKLNLKVERIPGHQVEYLNPDRPELSLDSLSTFRRLIRNVEPISVRGVEYLAIKLNKRAIEHAKQMVEKGSCVSDDKDMWSEHKPSPEEENKYIEKNGIEEYGKWFLGIDTDENEDNKGRYKFPCSDFTRVHRCGVLSAESRAGQYKHFDIEKAAAHLHGMIDVVKKGN